VERHIDGVRGLALVLVIHNTKDLSFSSRSQITFLVKFRSGDQVFYDSFYIVCSNKELIEFSYSHSGPM
jgi:hypothetical protein